MDILTYGSIALNKKASLVDVENEKEEILSYISKMQALMYEKKGIGLAANQVGILKRFFIVDIDQEIKYDDDENIIEHKAGNLLVYINPNVSFFGEIISSEEGCLSVPGVYECVQRYSKVKIEYYDINFAKKEETAEGLLAIVIQHEFDHLEGKLFIDRLSSIKKTIIKNKLKKGKIL